MRLFQLALFCFLPLWGCQSRQEAAREAAQALGQKVCACSGSAVGSPCRQELKEQIDQFRQQYIFSKEDSAQAAELRQIIRQEIRNCKARD